MAPQTELPDEKGVGQIDPVAVVDEALTAQGHARPQDWHRGVHPDALDATVDVNKRRFLVNRYWRTTVGALEEETSRARYMLVDNGPLEEWAKLFREELAPLITKHALPPAVQ